MSATPAAVAPAALPDRAYRYVTTALLTLGLAFAALPPGLRFPRGEPVAGSDSGAFGDAQWPVLFLFGAWVVLRRMRLALAMLPWINRTLPLLIGWFIVTALWSAAPGETLSRAIRLLALAGCAFAFVLASWEPGRLWRIARTALGVLAGVSVVVALLMPDIGAHGSTSPEVGKWRGITTHKNLLGALTALAALFWIHAWLAGQVRTRTAALWLAVCAVAIIGARSTTSLFAGVMAGAVMVLWLRPPTFLRGRALFYAAALLLLAAMPLHVYVVAGGSVSVTDVMQPVAEAAGKDVTLTGRADLWGYLLEEIPEHPWLGVGHGAYWLGEWSLSGRAVRELYWIPNQGHNFYLDLLNETGLVGLGLFILFLVSWMRTVRRLERIDHPLAVMNGTLLIFLLVHGITETAMARPITPLTVLMFFALFDMNRRLFEESLRRRASMRPQQPAQALALEHGREGEDHPKHERQDDDGRKPSE